MFNLKAKKKVVVAKGGFTLIETLVAVVIFSMTMVSLMTIASQGLKSARNSKESLMAQYFAQEGVEFVRNMRDASFLSLSGIDSWTDVFGTCLDSATPCAVDYENDTLVICSASECDIRKLTNGQYMQNTVLGDATGFVREISISTIPGDPKEIVVEVDAIWTDGNLSRNVSRRDNLLLWQ